MQSATAGPRQAGHDNGICRPPRPLGHTVRVPGQSSLYVLDMYRVSRHDDRVAEGTGGSKMEVSPVPSGYHTLTPYLIVDGAIGALSWYAEAFGARELMRL